jgi:ABC-type molybdate transport system permease subunit
MTPIVYSFSLKAGVVAVFIVSALVIVNAILSAKQLGGTLRLGLKKIAAGTIAHTILIAIYILLERGDRGILTDEQVSLFFVAVGIFGSTLLVLGYVQIYNVSKKLKLFTV